MNLILDIILFFFVCIGMSVVVATIVWIPYSFYLTIHYRKQYKKEIYQQWCDVIKEDFGGCNECFLFKKNRRRIGCKK